MNLQAVATAAEGWFGNLQETGWNNWFNQQVQAAETEFVTSFVQPYIASQVQALAKAGIPLTSQQVQDLYQAAANDIQQIGSQIKSVGIASIESSMTSELSSGVNNGQPQAKTKSDNSSDLRRLPNPDKFFNCANLSFIADGIGLGAAALGAEPIALGFGLIGFGLGAFSLAGFC